MAERRRHRERVSVTKSERKIEREGERMSMSEREGGREKEKGRQGEGGRVCKGECEINVLFL